MRQRTTKDRKTADTTPSKEALETAARMNRKALSLALSSATDMTVIGFVQANFDDIHEALGQTERREFALNFDIALGYEKRDDAAKAAAMKAVRATIIKQVGTARGNIVPLMSYFKRLKPADPVAIEKHLADKRKRQAEAREENRAAFRNIVSGLKNGASILGLAWSMGANLTYRPATRVWSAFCKRMNIGPIQSIAILTALLVGTTWATFFRPIDAKPHMHLYVSSELSEKIFREQCRDTRFTGGTDLTRAYMLAMMPTDKDSPTYNTRYLHYLSSMAALDQGVEPIVNDLLSRIETGNFFSTKATGSSAEGAYQSLSKTALEWVARHGKNLQAYKDAKARGEPQDLELVLAIDKLARDFKTNRDKLFADYDRGVVPLPYTAASNHARLPIFSGQLMAEEIKATAPELSIENLRGKSIAYIVDIIARKKYQGHLLGGEGKAFLDYVIEQAPDTLMNDRTALEKLYKKFRPDAGEAQVKRMGGYYARIAPGNPGIFKPKTPAASAAVTARSYQQHIVAFVFELTKTGANRVNAAMTNLSGDADACIADRALYEQHKAEIPSTTTRADVYWRTYVPKTLRDGASGLVLKFWDRVSDTQEPQRRDAISVLIEQTAPKSSL